MRFKKLDTNPETAAFGELGGYFLAERKIINLLTTPNLSFADFQKFIRLRNIAIPNEYTIFKSIWINIPLNYFQYKQQCSPLNILLQIECIDLPTSISYTTENGVLIYIPEDIIEALNPELITYIITNMNGKLDNEKFSKLYDYYFEKETNIKLSPKPHNQIHQNIPCSPRFFKKTIEKIDLKNILENILDRDIPLIRNTILKIRFFKEMEDTNKLIPHEETLKRLLHPRELMWDDTTSPYYLENPYWN